MGSSTPAECPTCSGTDFLMATLPGDISHSLDGGSGVVFAECEGCGDDISFDIVAERSRDAATETVTEEVTCPDCWANSVLSVELSTDALIQLPEGYLVLNVECLDCGFAYTVETVVSGVRAP